jgi:hypothetical protein
MIPIRSLLVASILISILVFFTAVAFSAQSSAGMTTEFPSATVAASVDETISPTLAPTNTCWDCDGSTYTWEEARVSICSPAGLAENPQMLDECFPDTWEWVCFPMPPDGSGTCEMYRRDLDPLGIFATPAPLPTPEPLPSPNPEPTATPSVEATPEPSNP